VAATEQLVDQSKKTMRHFYCRDVLWETFEQMANDFDCSIDYLINEAMRYYARSKNYQSPATSGVGPSMEGPGAARERPAATNPAPNTSPPRGRAAPTTQPPAMPPPARRNPPGPTPAVTPQAMGTARPQPPTPAGYSQPPAGYQGGGNSGGGGYGQQAAAGYGQPAGYGQAAPAVMPQAAGSTLFLIYNGQRYPVNKDQFIIGRGSKTSDLAIKDGNISRKHAAVIRRNGTYYIKDLGSTNGIDYKGMRIDNKRIDEGDVFHLCDYEIRFTYRPE
jgi:hypothetical protein